MVIIIRNTFFHKLFFLLILYPSVCLAQQSETIVYTSSPKEIDAYDKDWDKPENQHFNIINPRTLDTNQVVVRYAWDEQHLYGFVDVTDKQLIKLRSGTNNPTLNLGDAIEVFIDPFNDSRKLMDLNDYQFILDIGHDYAIFKGDKSFRMEGYQAPKDTGLATIAFDFNCRLHGTLNEENDSDIGYSIEFCLPWAGLGVRPKEGLKFRLDLCVDDMDAIVKLEDYTEQDTIVPYTFGSGAGEISFGFPDQWKVYSLAGNPDLLTKAWRYFGKTGFLLLIVLVAGITGLVVRQFLALRKLQALPRQSELQQTAAATWASEGIDHPDVPNAALFDVLRRFVLEKMDEDLRPEDLANKATMSLRQLQRVFREELNTSPHQFITMIKMEKAVNLLRGGSQNISEVAYSVGFNDPAYFSKVFKKYFGVSPRDIDSINETGRSE